MAILLFQPLLNINGPVGHDSANVCFHGDKLDVFVVVYDPVIRKNTPHVQIRANSRSWEL